MSNVMSNVMGLNQSMYDDVYLLLKMQMSIFEHILAVSKWCFKIIIKKSMLIPSTETLMSTSKC